MEIEEKYQEVDGVNIHYLVAGSGSPVLLLHGLGGSVNFWGYNIEPLSESHRVLAPDIPGYGLSDKSNITFSLDFAAQFIASFLQVQGLEAVSIIGHSMGGLLGTAFAIAHPQQVDRLVLVDSAGLGTELHWLLRLLTLPLLGEILATPTRMRIKILFRRLYYDPSFADSDLAETNYQERKLPGFKAALLATIRTGVDLRGQRESFIMLDKISNITVPILIIWGEQDQIIPVAHARAVHEHIDGSSLQILSPCGHCPQIEKADDFNRLVLDFLRF